jgi:hypothetical protein
MAIQTDERRLALRASRRPLLDLWLVGWPHNQSEGVFCQTHIKKKQPSKTSARKQRQTARPRGLVDRGTPLLSRVAAAFGPASAASVIRDVTPRLSSQVQPRITHPRHLPVLNTTLRRRTAHSQHSDCRRHKPHATRLGQHAAPKSFRNATHETRKAHALQSDNYETSTV